MSKTGWKWANRGGAIILALLASPLLASPLLAPQLLAFPYSTTIGANRLYSEVPIEPALEAIVANADAKVSRSPIANARTPDQPIFLTEGGWRWTWLAVAHRDAFALTRPLSEAVIVNRSDPVSDRVRNGRAVGGLVTLSGMIAHEMTHGLIRSHFGLIAAQRAPRQLVEGYCDYVAGRGSLSDAEAERLITTRTDHPALLYWHGRKKVETALQDNGGSIDALFADWSR